MINRDGFTLLEAMVSLVILSLVGLSALGAVGRDLDAAVRAKTALESAALAEERLEAVRLAAAADLDRLPDSLAAGTFSAPFDGYRWETDARAVSGVPGLYRVRIEVSWEGGGPRVLDARIYRRPRGAGS